MIKVYVKKLSNYPVSSVGIKKCLKELLTQSGITSNCEISVALVGEKKMYQLAQKYLGEKKVLHNVLSFTEAEVGNKFVYPPGGTIYLGEIVVCYQKAFQEAMTEGKKIEEKVLELISHGFKHLMGEHH